MTDETPRIAVLLGAGASKDAGLPLTDQLAVDLVAAINAEHDRSEDQRPAWLSALNFAYAAIVAYQSRDGSSPLQVVNIERLISALRLLHDRERHEAAPFVSGWRDPILPSGHLHVRDSLARDLIESLGQALGGSANLARDARQAAINAAYAIGHIAVLAKTPVTREAYGEADGQLLERLGDFLKVRNSVDYLYPVVDLATQQADGVDVISLNYDLALEQAGRERDVAIERGVENWPQQPVTFSTNQPSVRLYKLHGSLDWELQPSSGRFASPQLHVSPGITASPWLVMGDREKLATDGPTLDIFGLARAALERADHVVIVGYGFADAHVNNLVRDWLNRDPDRTLGVIDPTWPYPDSNTFRGWLINTFGPSERIQAFQGGARAVLREALATPRSVPAQPEIVVDNVEVGVEAIGCTVKLRLRGISLSGVSFYVEGGSHVELVGEHEILQNVRSGSGYQYLTEWSTDLPAVLRLAHLPADGRTIRVRGRGLVQEHEISVRVAHPE